MHTSRSDSNELVAPVKENTKKKKKKKKKAPARKITIIPMLLLDSPAMGTRSKKLDPASPVLSTRSKRRLSL
jgi:hypothetical protein